MIDYGDVVVLSEARKSQYGTPPALPLGTGVCLSTQE